MDKEDRTVKNDSAFFLQTVEVSEMVYRCINVVCQGGKLLAFKSPLENNAISAECNYRRQESQFWCQLIYSQFCLLFTNTS